MLNYYLCDDETSKPITFPEFLFRRDPHQPSGAELLGST
jgi:hypothetical protein